MKSRLIVLCILAAFLVSVSAARAEDTGAVILATDANYPDTLIAGVIGETLGIPVLLTSPGSLPSETESGIIETGAKTIYIIGGPAVISESVEDKLAQNYSVVRLWGMTRVGTAVAAVENFWDSAPKAVLVREFPGSSPAENSELLSGASDLAEEEKLPMLLIHYDNVPSEVVDALGNLSTKDVVIIGKVGDGVRETLASMGIAISENIMGDDENKTRKLVEGRIREKARLRVDRPLIVVAMGNWTDAIKAPFRPNGTSRHITSESQIDELIAEIRQNNYSRIMIVGKPELAGIVYGRLTAAGINATLVSGSAAKVAAQIMKEEMHRIREIEAAVRARLRNINMRMAAKALNGTDEIIAKVGKLLDDAGISGQARERVLDVLRELKADMEENYMEGNYTRAIVSYRKMEDQPARLLLKYKERLAKDLEKLVEREKNLQEKLSELRQRRALADLADRLRADRTED
jgi:putative cell wall-binding protein